MLDNKLEVLVQKKSAYVDVYNSCFIEKIGTASTITFSLHRTERHVDIIGMQSSLDSLLHLLNVTKSLSVTYDNSMKTFGYLSPFEDLEECELRWCHKMEEGLSVVLEKAGKIFGICIFVTSKV